MKLTPLAEYLFSSCFDRLSLARRLATLSFCARCLFRHFRPRSRCMIRTTEDRERPVSLDIWRVERWVCGSSPWLCHLLHRSHTFCSECALRRFCLPLPCLRSVLPVSRSFAVNLSSPSFVQFIPGNLASSLREPYHLKFN